MVSSLLDDNPNTGESHGRCTVWLEQHPAVFFSVDRRRTISDDLRTRIHYHERMYADTPDEKNMLVQKFVQKARLQRDDNAIAEREKI